MRQCQQPSGKGGQYRYLNPQARVFQEASSRANKSFSFPSLLATYTPTRSSWYIAYGNLSTLSTMAFYGGQSSYGSSFGATSIFSSLAPSDTTTVVDTPAEPQFPVHMSAAQKKKLKLLQHKEKKEKARKEEEERLLQRSAEWEEQDPAPVESIFSFSPSTTLFGMPGSPVSPTPQVSPTHLAKPQDVGEPEAQVPSRNPTPLPSPPPPPFKVVRAELICQVHLEILNGGSFADTNVHLYSRRNRAGSPYAPRALALNRRILEAASHEFEKCEFIASSCIVAGCTDALTYRCFR